LSEIKITLAKAKVRREHWLRIEKIEGFQSVQEWLSGRCEATKRTYAWSMQEYTDWIRKTPDELVLERNKEFLAPDMLTWARAEKSLERFRDAYPDSTTMIITMKAMKSFYKSHRMALQGVRIPPQESLTVREKDRLPNDQEIIRMCDLADLEDRLVVMIGGQTGMRASSLVMLRYKHLGDDFEAGKIPCRVIIPLYEREFEKYGYMTFILEDTVKVLREYLNSRKKLGEEVESETRIFGVGACEARKVVRELARKAGVVPPDSRGITGFRSHCFRKRVQTVLEGG
jgi:integrase